MNDGLIAIWRKHGDGEEFGEFLVKTVYHSYQGQSDYDDGSSCLERLENASYDDLLRWARERFGIEA